MPTYHYRCSECEQHVEVWQSMSDEPLTVCEACGGPLQRVLQPVGIVLKGSGFYRTDNRSSAKGDKAAPKSGDGAASSDSKGDSKGDSKSDSKSDSKGSKKSDAGSGGKGDAKGAAKAADAKSA